MKLIFRINLILIIAGFISTAVTSILAITLGINVFLKDVEMVIAIAPWFLRSATIAAVICIAGLLLANKIESELIKESG